MLLALILLLLVNILVIEEVVGVVYIALFNYNNL